MIESNIRMDEVVVNKDRKFGANLEYFPVIITLGNGQEMPALFTANDLDVAKERASKNPEDCQGKQKSFWQSLFGG